MHPFYTSRTARYVWVQWQRGCRYIRRHPHVGTGPLGERCRCGWAEMCVCGCKSRNQEHPAQLQREFLARLHPPGQLPYRKQDSLSHLDTHCNLFHHIHGLMYPSIIMGLRSEGLPIGVARIVLEATLSILRDREAFFDISC